MQQLMIFIITIWYLLHELLQLVLKQICVDCRAALGIL